MRNDQRFLVSLLLAACAATSWTSTVHASDDETFGKLELAWMDALAAKDAATLERMLAPEFKIVGATFTVGDKVGTRAEWLEVGLKRPFPRHQVEVLDTTVVGGTAVVHAVLRGTYPPSPFAPTGGLVTFVVTDTWVERDGAWQVVARHAGLARAAGGVD